MCRFPLFETLAVQDGVVQNLAYHQARYDAASRDYLGSKPHWALAEIVDVPPEFQHGLVRAKLSYNALAYQLQFFAYQPKKIDTFRVVEVENWDYRFKYSDRSRFDGLPITPNSEVIIVNNGKVSDCTIGNLLFLKQNRWFSPQDYLLKGTQLSRLLDEKRVELCEISRENLCDFEQVMLINALNLFDPARAVSMQAVHFA